MECRNRTHEKIGDALGSGLRWPPFGDKKTTINPIVGGAVGGVLKWRCAGRGERGGDIVPLFGVSDGAAKLAVEKETEMAFPLHNFGE